MLGLKMLAGGTLVVAFSLVAEVLKPKSFSGLFAAAPSVAIASLLVTALASSPAKAALASDGMIAGAIGLVAACATATLAVRRFGALWGSGLAWLAWVAAAALAFLVLP